MPRPPSSYQHEPGVTICGDTWPLPVTATGELTGANGFGDDLTHRIEPIVPYTDPKLEKAGRLEEWETELREAARVRIAAIIDERSFFPSLTTKDYASISWLLDRATEELDAILDLYDAWTHRVGGSYPLSLGDAEDDFPQIVAHGFSVCSRSDIRCPGADECQQRKRDRAKIREHLRNALRHIRCAEYSMHRVRLVRESLVEIAKLPDSNPQKSAWIRHWARIAAQAASPGQRPTRTTPDDLLPDPAGLGEVDTGPIPPPPAKTEGMSTTLKVLAGVGAAVVLFNFLKD
jgi:hypothetical protein